MKYYDVIVIGAGPAGLKCADVLSLNNRKVLLLEKNAEIGPKICAGGLIENSFRKLKLPKHLIDYTANEIVVDTPYSNVLLDLDKPITYTVDRKRMGQWQLMKLHKENIEIKTQARVQEIAKDHLIFNGEKVFFKYLVGADGSLSVVRKHLRLKTEKFLLANQFIIEKKEQYKLSLYLRSSFFHSWYAWIFPHKDYISIGCGSDPKVFPTKKVLINFKKWLKETNIDYVNEVAHMQSFVINCDYQGYKFGNIFLIGDAAGLGSYLTGEGIYEAIVSGEEVANELINENFHSVEISKILVKKKKHLYIHTLIKNSGIFRDFLFFLLSLMMRNKKLFNYLSGLL